MKKLSVILAGMLLCLAAATVIGQKQNLTPKQERREIREKRRAQRIAEFEQSMDSTIDRKSVV